MALAKSSAPAVRSLAADLLDQQDVSGDELLRLLHQRGMAPPMLANNQRKTLNRLARLQGRKFDREFLVQVALKSQQDEVLDYEKAAAMAGDPDAESLDRADPARPEIPVGDGRTHGPGRPAAGAWPGRHPAQSDTGRRAPGGHQP